MCQAALGLSLKKSCDEKTANDLTENVSVTTPEYFPRRAQTESQPGGRRVKLTQSAKLIHCVTENGITKCFTRTTRTAQLLPEREKIDIV